MTNLGVTVVGGSYGEDCSFPRSLVYRGSGMRAASILAALGHDTSLVTLHGPLLGAEFSAICERKGITLLAMGAPSDVWFRYRHPLSKPDIYPSIPPSVSIPTEIVVNNAIVFGMIEGRPRVTAKRAVYDPQDGIRAKPFEDNGSHAEELAIVVSLSEGRALTGLRSAEEIASALLSHTTCKALIVKCGPEGAFVATPELHEWIRSFPSKKVWKIGSGDVFSAAFAHEWMLKGSSVLSAAWFASRLVAEYVSTRMELFSPERLLSLYSEAAEAASSSPGTPRQVKSATIYLAGPFFTTGQQWLVDEARSALRELGFSVFSPIHEIGEGPPNEVAAADLFALEQSDLVYALIDGLDAGTVFEIGYARSRNIPVVCLAESVDLRSLTMLLGSGCHVLDDFATSIYTTCWQLINYG